MEEADEVLPLASSQGGKLFHVIRSSFVDSLEASLKSYHTRLTQVHSSQGFTSHTVVFPVLTLHQSTLNLAYLYHMLTSYFLVWGQIHSMYVKTFFPGWSVNLVLLYIQMVLLVDDILISHYIFFSNAFKEKMPQVSVLFPNFRIRLFN